MEWTDKEGNLLGYGPNPDCPKCKGSGFLHPVKGGVIDYSKVVYCDARGCLLDQYRAHEQGIPYRAKRGIKTGQTFDTFKQVLGSTEALQAVLKFTELREFIWLLLYGGVGNGKTHLGNAAANKLCYEGRDARIFTTPELFSQLRQAMPSNTADQLLSEWKQVNVLIIDDYGMEYGSTFEQARLEELIDYRYREVLPLMLITNKDIADLPPRLASRFMDQEIARAVHNQAPDYRAKKKARKVKR